MFARTFLQLFLLTALVGQLYAAPLGDPLQVRHLTADSSAHPSGIYPRSRLFKVGEREPGSVSRANAAVQQHLHGAVSHVKNVMNHAVQPVRAGVQSLKANANKLKSSIGRAHAKAHQIEGKVPFGEDEEAGGEEEVGGGGGPEDEEQE